MAAVLVRGESSQGELLVELVNAPGATRRVRRPQVGLGHSAEACPACMIGVRPGVCASAVIGGFRAIAHLPAQKHLSCRC